MHALTTIHVFLFIITISVFHFFFLFLLPFHFLLFHFQSLPMYYVRSCNYNLFFYISFRGKCKQDNEKRKKNHLPLWKHVYNSFLSFRIAVNMNRQMRKEKCTTHEESKCKKKETLIISSNHYHSIAMYVFVMKHENENIEKRN